MDEPIERPLEEKILQLIRDMPNCTYDALAESLGVSRSTVKRKIKLLTEQDRIERWRQALWPLDNPRIKIMKSD